MRHTLSIFTLFWLLGHPMVDANGVDASHHWHQWRGPLATGVAPYADPPVEWSEEKNIRWKIELPGSGTFFANRLGGQGSRDRSGALRKSTEAQI